MSAGESIYEKLFLRQILFITLVQNIAHKLCDITYITFMWHFALRSSISSSRDRAPISKLFFFIKTFSEEISPCRSEKPGTLNLDQTLATTFEISENDEDFFAADDSLLDSQFESLVKEDLVGPTRRPGTPQPWMKGGERSRDSGISEPPSSQLGSIQEVDIDVSRDKATKRIRESQSQSSSPGTNSPQSYCLSKYKSLMNSKQSNPGLLKFNWKKSLSNRLE